jgi:hypothetical protein
MVLDAIHEHINAFFTKYCPAIKSRLDSDLTETREPFRRYYELVHTKLSEDPEYDVERHIASYTVIDTTLKFHAMTSRGTWAKVAYLNLKDGLRIELDNPKSFELLDLLLHELLQAVHNPLTANMFKC